jgi:hypothetical protein
MHTRTWISAATLATLAFSQGCATAPAPGQYVAAPAGTVTTYHRVSSGSYGNVDNTVTWTHTLGDWQGRPAVLAVSPQAGTTVYDPQSHGTIANLSPAGQPVTSFDPPMGMRFPLEVGKSWTDQHKLTVHARGATMPYEIRYRVEAYESITVPAGTYMAFRVQMSDSFGEQYTYWTAPSRGLGTIRRVLDRPPTHPQGAGHLEGVLTSEKRPG